MPKEKKSKRKRPRDEDQPQTSEYFDYEDDSNPAHGSSSKDDLTSAVPAAAAVDVEATNEEDAEEDAYGAKDFRSQVNPVKVLKLFHHKRNFGTKNGPLNFFANFDIFFLDGAAS